MRITIGELRQIIREEVSTLHRRRLYEFGEAPPEPPPLPQDTAAEHGKQTNVHQRQLKRIAGDLIDEVLKANEGLTFDRFDESASFGTGGIYILNAWGEREGKNGEKIPAKHPWINSVEIANVVAEALITVKYHGEFMDSDKFIALKKLAPNHGIEKMVPANFKLPSPAGGGILERLR